jgi:competence protein ComEC
MIKLSIKGLFTEFSSAALCFWRKNPALFLGFQLLLASSTAFFWHPIYLFVIVLLFAPFLNRQKIWHCIGGLILMLSFFCYARHLYSDLEHLEKKTEGTARFKISRLQVHQSPFQRSFVYKGILTTFKTADGTLLHHIPCQIYTSLNTDPPSADCDYFIEGTLYQKELGGSVFKPRSKDAWQKIPHTFSVSQIRFEAKDAIRQHLKKSIEDPKSAAFLTALFVGDVDENTLRFEFNKLGLQHILAISGFHFTLIAGFFALLLRPFLSPRKAAFFSLVLLSLYFLFLGPSASITRAYIAISIFLIGTLVNLRISALNALGVGLLIELLLDPHVITQIGFQLSFLSTLAILQLFTLVDRFFCTLLPKRPFSEVVKLGRVNQHGALLAGMIRSAFSLNVAVHLALIPPLLYLFHKFPLMSLCYNLFFPLWVSLSLVLLITALLFSPLLPFVGQALHALNNYYTSKILLLTSHSPATLDIWLRPPTLPYSLVICYLALLFFAAIFLEHRKSKIF